MSSLPLLNFETIKNAVAGTGAAFRAKTPLQPAGGSGDKIFPPTYEGGAYALEIRVIDGQRVPCVVLDSVPSQANRIELAVLRAIRRGEIRIPLVEVDFSSHFPDIGRISTLEAPHRIADAILRDSVGPDGKTFRETEAGRSFTDATAADATGLFEWCPTALVLGMWDSTGPKGGLGAKFARALVSEIIGIDVEAGAKTSSRIDPLQVQRAAGVLFETNDKRWTLDEAGARKEKGKPVKLGKDGKPSEANHGNVAPTLEPGRGGVTLSRALQITTLSLPALRRLRFPVKGRDDERRNDAARTVLAALAVYGATLAQSAGLDLRSRCLLVPAAPPVWELLDGLGGDSRSFNLTGEQARANLQEALLAARELGLPWREEPLTLAPIPDLVTLVQRSRDLARGAEQPE